MPDTPQNSAKPLKTALPATLTPAAARAQGRGPPGPHPGHPRLVGIQESAPPDLGSEGSRAVLSIPDSHRRTPLLAVLVAGGETWGSWWVSTAGRFRQHRWALRTGLAVRRGIREERLKPPTAVRPVTSSLPNPPLGPHMRISWDSSTPNSNR